MRHWLMKTEPETFSLDDLRRSPNHTAPWDGVRNYQARNHMRDGMRLGDPVLIYHSSTEHRAIVGLAHVAREAYPDHSAWDPKSDHYDRRSAPENPVWIMVDVCFDEEFPQPLSLEALRGIPELGEMMLLRRGMRLSVQPVTAEQFLTVLAYGRGERALPEVPEPARPSPRKTPAERKAKTGKMGHTSRPAAKRLARPAQSGTRATPVAPRRPKAKTGRAPGRRAR